MHIICSFAFNTALCISLRCIHRTKNLQLFPLHFCLITSNSRGRTMMLLLQRIFARGRNSSYNHAPKRKKKHQLRSEIRRHDGGYTNSSKLRSSSTDIHFVFADNVLWSSSVNRRYVDHKMCFVVSNVNSIYS